MRYGVIGYSAGALIAFFLTQPVYAQDPAPGLQDLVGARGSSGEQVLEERGYRFVKGEKSGGSSYTNWLNARTGKCITVRTANGRYQSIVTSPVFDCQDGATENVPVEKPDKTNNHHFATVCGVTVGSKLYRYPCKLEGAAPGGHGKTVLHYPDQTITLNWHGGRHVSVIFEGMKPQRTTYNTSEGTTQFVFEDKTYFYISDRDAAKMEVRNFHQ